MRNFKRIAALIVMAVTLLMPQMTAYAEAISGEIVTASDGDKYEYVVMYWYVTEAAPDGTQVESPRPCGEAIPVGGEKTITFNQSYQVSTKIGAEAGAKLGVGLSIPIKLVTLSVTREFNFKISGERSYTYTQSISKTDKITFSKAMEDKGYNTCVPYSGIIYNTCNVTVDIYKVHEYSHRHWFLGKKHTHTERGDFVRTDVITAKQPIVVIFCKYSTVSLDKSATIYETIYLNSNDTIMLN